MNPINYKMYPFLSPTVLGLMETNAIALLSLSSSKAASSASASDQPITAHVNIYLTIKQSL